VHLVATVDGLARIEGDQVALLDLPCPDVGALLAAGEGLAPARAARVRTRRPLGEVAGRLVPPLGGPRAIWGVGLNYHSKASLTGRAVPTEPLLYLKAPTAQSAPGSAVTLPADRTTQVDYEGEVAVIIGRPMHAVHPCDAWAYVAGISPANDITARDIMAATASPTLAKSFPGFGPVGPSVLDVAAIADRHAIDVRTSVNGVWYQDSTTAEQIFPVPELLSWISRFAVLAPGDIVLTGTPAGTGQDRGEFLRPGDVVEVVVGDALPLRTEFRAAPGQAGTRVSVSGRDSDRSH
jgi:2-keto-4-pentenoate hydratase/2-oxohepta-3-ene-1,7-dioic acid hydratase in catechol pathway